MLSSSKGRGGDQLLTHCKSLVLISILVLLNFARGKMSGPVGFIGLGIMGKGMLKNLVTKLDPSLNYIVWNR